MTDLEIEVKIPLRITVDPREMRAAASEVQQMLEGYGWYPELSVRHRDTYLQHPSRDMADSDEALRIRTVKDLDDGRARSYVTYKGPKVSGRSKTRYEREVRIMDPGDMKDLFYRLGFKKILVVEKERKVYTMDDIKACVDVVPELGCFMELEIMGNDARKGEERLEQVMEDLDLHGSERRSYLEMLLQKLV